MFAARNNNEDTCKAQERDNAIVKTKIDKDKDLLKLAHDYEEFILKLSDPVFK